MLMGELIMPRVTADSEGDDGVLRGTPASTGRVTGTARIVHSEADFHLLEPGDIVVCPGTRPSWSVIFPMIGGLVADAGGSLASRDHRAGVRDSRGRRGGRSNRDDP